MQNNFIISLSIIIGFSVMGLLVGLVIYLKPQPIQENKFVKLDITDRENGICAEMYAEGYEWGFGQIPLQFGIWKDIENKNDNLIKELLFDMVNNLNN